MHTYFFSKNAQALLTVAFTAVAVSGFCGNQGFAQSTSPSAPTTPALPPMNTSGSSVGSTSSTAPVQAPAQNQNSLDTQLPWDASSSLFVYTSEMEAAFALFPSFANLVEARLFQAADSSYTLEVVQFLSGKQQRNRVALTAQEAQDLRSRITSAVQSTGMQGRSEVYLTEWEKISFALGTGGTGLAYGFLADFTAIASQPNSARSPFVFNSVGTILTPLAFAGATYWATQQPWFTRSSALMISSGLATGLFHGFALAGLVTDFRAVTGTPLLLTAIGVGVAEAGFGMRLPEQLGMNYGQTTLMTSMGSSGLLTGILAPAALGVFDRTSANNGEFLIRALSASVLGVSAGGFFLGYKLGQTQHFAGGDGVVMSLPTSFLGLLPAGIWFLGFPLGGSSDPSQLKLIAGLTVLADAGGYWLGHELIRNKDFTFEQGRNIVSAAGWGTLAVGRPQWSGDTLLPDCHRHWHGHRLCDWLRGQCRTSGTQPQQPSCCHRSTVFAGRVLTGRVFVQSVSVFFVHFQRFMA
jgi:hypothetical protein